MVTTVSRVLALDLGRRRVGVAVSDPLGQTAQPLTVLDAGDDQRLAGEVAHLCRQYEVDTLVVGLPLNMDGTAGPEAQRARRLAQRLREQLGLPVVEWDERLSTAAAERMLVAADLSRARRRRVRDKVAAAVILQSYLDSRARRVTRDGAPAEDAPAAGGSAAGGSAGDA
ncbi:MAG: Holliday junction resolvase RuvX [Thermaerobacter sp.]